MKRVLIVEVRERHYILVRSLNKAAEVDDLDIFYTSIGFYTISIGVGT